MQSAQVDNKKFIPTGSVPKSRGDRYVCADEQVLCVSVLQRGQ